MRAARTMLFSGVFALQTFCNIAVADLPPVDAAEAIFLRRITEFWKEGHFDDVKKQLLNYLSKYPSSAYLNEVHSMLGDVYLREGAPEKALEYYEKITSKKCESLTLLNRLECLYRLARFEALIDWAKGHPPDGETLEAAQKNRFYLLLADAYYHKALSEENPSQVIDFARNALECFSKSEGLEKEWEYTIAYLHALIGEKDLAAQCYLHLSQVFPDQQEELIFQAASLIYKAEPSRAIELFHKIAEGSSSLKLQAVCNELTLLFREKNYEEFLSQEKNHRELLDAEEKSLFAFFRGSSYLYLSNFSEAIPPFREFLKTNPSSKEELRFVLQGLIMSGYKTANLEVLNEALERWRKELPIDGGYLDGLFATAEISSKLNQHDIASAIFKQIIEQFPDHPKREAALFDYAQVLLLQGRFSEGRDVLEQFVHAYPSSGKSSLAWQNLIHTSFEILGQSEKSERDALRSCLALTLKKALETPDLFSSDQLRTYRLNLSQLLFELGERSEAALLADQYLKMYPDHVSSHSVHLMLIACHVTLGSPVETLISVTEAALDKETDPSLQNKLHLQLYNSYLAQGSLEKAADHLLSVYNASSSTLKKENLFWLAEQMERRKEIALARGMLEKAIGFDGRKFENRDAIDPNLLEEIALHLKDLYQFQNDVVNVKQILAAIIDLQTNEKNVSWRFQRRALFELGQLHETQGQIEEALAVYNRLIGDAAYSQASYYLRAALLQRAKLQFAGLTEQQRRESSADLLNILGILKDLQIAKNAASEPVHLEASLEYASIRSILLPEEQRIGKMIYYLERIQEDFSIPSNEISSNYLKERANLPEQDALIKRYLRFIAAEGKRLKSLEAKKSGQMEISTALEIEAKNDLQLLAEEITEVSTPLDKRVKEALGAID